MSMQVQPPKVSVILLVWNNQIHLTNCLEALRNQTLKNFEIIFIDNGSSDARYLDDSSLFSGLDVRVERLETNRGFSFGNNLGVSLARGEWIALLNLDAYPEPEWLEALVRAVEQHPHYGSFASRQLQYHAPHLLDGAGDAYHITGLAWRIGYNLQTETSHVTRRDIFSPCGAAALYHRDAFLKFGGFDEDYFTYFEDVDLGFRIRLGGGKCLYVPEAVVHHVGSASTGKRSDFSVYYGYRNLIWTFFKNMPSPLLMLFLPLHILTLSFFIFYLTLRGQGRVIWKAAIDALLGLPAILKKRKTIQRTRAISSRELLKVMSTSMFEPYREFTKRNQTK